MFNNRLIDFDDGQKIFHLHNGDISYIISVEQGGLLSHLYFGRYVSDYHGGRKYPRMDRGHSGNLPGSKDRTFSKDTLLQEYTGNNTGDYRNPACIFENTDGSRTVDMRYVDFEIVDGNPDLIGLPHSYVVNDDEAETLVIYMADATTLMTTKLFYTIYRNFPIVTRHVEVQNDSDNNIMIDKIASMQMDLPKQELDVISLPDSYARERQVQRQRIRRGTLQFESRRDSSSHQMNPFIALTEPKTDEFSGAAIGLMLVYSGNHQFNIERDQSNQTRITIGISDYGFEWQLASGESFITPEVIMSYTDNGLNKMSNTLHKLLRNRVARGKYMHQQRPILINNWEATYFDFNADKIQNILDSAAPLGIEMFVLDDGWFGHRNDDKSSLGDWFVNKNKLPKGLKDISNRVHQKGMSFGLWFEPECISEDSNLFKMHPEYVLGVPGRPRTVSRDQYVLDFSRQDVIDNIYQQMSKILDNVPIDYIKWDFNRNLTEVFSEALSVEKQGEVSHKYVLGVYQLMNRLTQDYPNILFEGCSGGGGRFDAGILYYMPQSWPSDNNDPIERLKIQYGTSLAYPISSITSHVGASPDELLGRFTSLYTRGAVASSGTLGYELDVSKLSDQEKDEIEEQINFYKAHRQLVQYGHFYRLESPFESEHVSWMFVSQDAKQALLFNFTVLAEVQSDFHLTKLCGLNPEFQYREEKTGEIFGGDELMNIGLYDEPIQNRDFSATIRFFQAK
ncbi:alpha-galactosidase [Lentilactobacillus hilgardii]|uniref:alpha-galactosidase n=1 Tax=Lentilactobacillus hilgardii TaxID=1588 RepID=UPI0021A6080C|nr:alpha-galactosidase [Lentilactobacillus hilgardii]MCT3399988.1 alpha-galactosidase [Lentilactobacillus hilgardii]